MVRSRADGSVARNIKTLFNLGSIASWSDGQLLENFTTGHGEPRELAFAALVERHGPMVLRVCRNLVRDVNDAQDAFQATFLVLVRKARGLWVRDSLGPWLHQTACRAALCARSAAARRARHERNAAAQRTEAQPAGSDDLHAKLHLEINRLPARFQDVIVLCDLQGQSHEQAARSLGCPVGTVKSRQARARERLRQRLCDRKEASALLGAFAHARADIAGALIPDTLATATQTAALAAISSHATALPAINTLTQGVLRTMFVSQSLKLGAVMLGVGGAISGTLLVSRGLSVAPALKTAAKQDPDAKSYEVKAGPLRLSVVERGTLESSRSATVASAVEGQTTILSILPEGTHVKKGDLVAELNSASLRDHLANQQIATERARADLDQARKTLEVAEISVEEYVEGVQVQEFAAATAEMEIAKEGVSRAKDRTDRAVQARERIKSILGRKSAHEVTAQDVLAELEIEDRLAARALDSVQAKHKLELSEQTMKGLSFTARKKRALLERDVEKAKSDLLAKNAAFEREHSLLKKLEQQIQNCKLLAPNDGLIVYATVPHGQDRTEEGVTVRERQPIFSIPDFAHMRVNAAAHEAMVHLLAPGQPVQIKVDAYPNQSFNGKVTSVAPMPSIELSSGAQRKYYPTFIEIEDPGRGLRPGMTAQVDIEIQQLDNVIQIPTTAVVRVEGKTLVRVQTENGDYVLREVTLGASDDRTIEVKSGLKPGERISLEPAASARRGAGQTSEKPASAPK